LLRLAAGFLPRLRYIKTVNKSARNLPWDTLLDGRFDSKRPGHTLWALFSDQRKSVYGALALYVIKQAPMSLLPLVVGMIVDALTPVREDSWRRILWISAGYVVLLAQNPVMHTFFVRLMSRVLRQMQFMLRSALVERLQQLAMTFYDEKQSGALQTKILRDVDAIDGLCRHLLHNGLNAALIILYVTVISLAKQPLLTAYFVLTVPAGVGLLKLFDRRFRRHYQALRVETEQMNARVFDMLQMLPITRAHGLEEHEARGVRTTFHRLRKRGLEVDTITELFAASSWLTFSLFQLACLVFSSWLVVQHRITVGEAVMYHTYFGMLVGSVQQLLSVFPALAQGTEAIRSIGEVLEAPQLESYEGKPAAPMPLRGEITFENVSYSYTQGREVALRNISLTISAGETVAFVGESGAGKSTLINLAIGFRHPTAGRVTLDGQDLRDMDLRTYRQQIGVVPRQRHLRPARHPRRETLGHPCPSQSSDLRARTSRRARHAAGRSGRPPLGRTTSTPRHRARPRARSATHLARRSDIGARHGVRTARPRSSRAPVHRADHTNRGAPLFHHSARTPGCGVEQGRDR
jgi:ATP-binding cassette subfamily B protein